MDKAELVELISSFDSETEIKEGKQFTEINVPAANLHQLAKQLNENKDTWFDFLFCLSGVDYGSDLGVSLSYSFNKTQSYCCPENPYTGEGNTHIRFCM